MKIPTASEDLDKLTATVSLQRLAEARGAGLEHIGDHLEGRCPFHEADVAATVVIDPSANTWSCSTCNVADGGVIEWVMRAEGVSRTHAVELLRADKLAASNTGTVKKSSVRKLEPFVPVDSPDEVVMARVVEFYADALRQDAAATEYLRNRKLDNAELVQHFRLGYSGRALGYRLPERNRKAGAALRGQLERLGVFRSSGHEHLSGSLVVAILDAGGGVIDLYGRKITSALRAGTPQHVTLGEQPRGVFNLANIADAQEVILCKSIIDAMSFWVSGHRAVIATYGLHGFTAAHAAAIKNVGKFIIAFDRSKAGDTAAEQLADVLGREGKQVFRVVFPWGQDANDYLRAGESFDALVRAAQWMVGKSRPVIVPTTIMSTRDSGVDDSGVDGVPPVDAESPVEQPTKDAAIEVNDNEVVMRFGSRTWRIRGHDGCTSLASIRVNIRVGTDYGFFSDTLDVLAARARASFLKQAREELEVEERILKSDLGHVVLRVEELVDAALRERLEPKRPTHTMGEADREAALALLRDPHLVERIVADFDRCGIVGEADNKLIGYLATVSRRLEEPLAVVIQSSSAAGKSSLMDAILRFTPEEEQVSYSAMTGQSLFYMGALDLQHKVLAISEEAGITQAAYALRVLQSAGHLTIASTGKDQQTGRLSTHEYRVQGPVAILMTTTSANVDEELLNRCLVLAVDEGVEQTRAIHALQRRARTLEGLLAKHERINIEQLHQNAQRLLVPLHVVNPFATELPFTGTSTRSRRDQKKLLGLIDAVALLHQHQRPHKTAEVGGMTMQYIEASTGDVELAVKLIGPMLTRATEDMPPQTSRMLHLVRELVASESSKLGVQPKDVRFTRRVVREQLGWTEKQTRVHLGRLLDLEHVTKHRAVSGQRHLYGLADAATMATVPGVALGLPSKQGQGFHQPDPALASTVPSSAKDTSRGNGSEKSYRSRSSHGGR